MSEPSAPSTLSTHPAMNSSPSRALSTWEAALEVAVCETCHGRFLVPCGSAGPACPICWGGRLAVLPDELPEKVHTAPPELMLPCSISETALRQQLQNFCESVPFAPSGLKLSNLTRRITKAYLPMWLVDADIYAYWQAEAGFDYQVISHQEVYDDNRKGWISKEMKEPRVRWENRVGRLKRAYQNIPVPALEDAARLEKQLGAFHQEDARTYSPEELGSAVVRLPEISPRDSWKEAVAAFQKTAESECRMASGANRMREFRWKAQFSRQNWTLMLMPVYATSYRDDDGHVHPILVHGQTGKIAGKRRASTKRAFRESLMIFGAGVLIFLIGLLMAFVFPDLHRAVTAVSSYVILLGFVCILGAGAPYMLAWDFNRKQEIAQK